MDKRARIKCAGSLNRLVRLGYIRYIRISDSQPTASEKTLTYLKFTGMESGVWAKTQVKSPAKTQVSPAMEAEMLNYEDV